MRGRSGLHTYDIFTDEPYILLVNLRCSLALDRLVDAVRPPLAPLPDRAHRCVSMPRGGDSWPERTRFESTSIAEAARAKLLSPSISTGSKARSILLLELARRQKVDLARISILALAEQYLAVRRGGAQAAARTRRRLSGHGRLARLSEVSSASSRPSAASRAGRLGARRRSRAAPAQRWRPFARPAEFLINRPRLGRDFFARGRPGAGRDVPPSVYEASLYDLSGGLCAAGSKTCAVRACVSRPASVWSLAEAREALTRLIGGQSDWTAFDDLLLEACADPGMRRSARASSFSASLELVREGKIEMRQERTFAPLWLRPTGPTCRRGRRVTVIQSQCGKRGDAMRPHDRPDNDIARLFAHNSLRARVAGGRADRRGDGVRLR